MPARRPETAEAKPLAGRAARRAKGPGPGKRIRITQVKSFIGFDERQRRVIAGLGLSRPGRSVELEDTPSTRGMIAKVPHLVRVEELADSKAKTKGAGGRGSAASGGSR